MGGQGVRGGGGEVEAATSEEQKMGFIPVPLLICIQCSGSSCLGSWGRKEFAMEILAGLKCLVPAPIWFLCVLSLFSRWTPFLPSW